MTRGRNAHRFAGPSLVHRLHALDIDVQNADLALLADVRDALLGSAVVIAVHRRVFNELSVPDRRLHGRHSDKVVALAVHLFATRNDQFRMRK